MEIQRGGTGAGGKEKFFSDKLKKAQQELSSLEQSLKDVNNRKE
jgi:hypothetical protein